MKTRSNRLNNGYVGGNFLDNSQYGVLSVNKQASSNVWTRPTDWLSLPSMVEGDSKIAGLVAVYPGDTGSTGITASSNFVAFTVYGNYTVDWGDGISESYSSGATASKQYLWEGASASTLTSDGFRQRVFQITPQASAGLTRANFVAFYPGVNLQAAYFSPILDLKISGASLAIINPPKGLVQFEYVGDSNITTCSLMFTGCTSLCSVIGTSWTKKSNSFNNMFSSCGSLQTVPLFNTASGIDFNNMFNSCSSLQTVPLFNTAQGTNFSAMFAFCRCLKTVPLFNTEKATQVNSMFTTCSSLITVPLFNTAAVNTGASSSFAQMFTKCTSLQTVPLFNTAQGIDLGLMFNGCTSLQTVPLFNVSAATNFNNTTGTLSIFGGCPNLKSAALDARTNPNGRSISYLNCALSAAELNRIFTYLGSGVLGSSTITITGNWGANTCNRSIAIAKNWTVAE